MSRSNPDAPEPAPVADRDPRRQEHDAAVGRWYRHVHLIKAEFERDEGPDLHYVAQLWGEISHDDQIAMWLAHTKGGVFTTHEREVMKYRLPREVEA